MNEPVVMDRAGFDRLVSVLADRGYEVIGPTVQASTIVYDTIDSSGDLPVGWTDHHEPGTYRLEHRDDGKLFGYVVGPHSWKQYLNPPQTVIWSGELTENGIETRPAPPTPRYAFIGARPCELAALAILDHVYTPDGFEPTNQTYADRRQNAFIVAVNCTEPGGTCFCTSMGTGPSASSGYDLVITEVTADGETKLLVEAGSDAGSEVLAAAGQLAANGGFAAATDAETARASELLATAAESMGRSLDTEGIKELLQGNATHPRWTSVAERCLACTNCTLVCPTCFCNTIEDSMELAAPVATRTRKWDSCFTLDFSYLHGFAVRESTTARYRQWMTHKLASWIDQYGMIGCVGCGRCITWCPVGIDITEEAAAIRRGDLRNTPVPAPGGAR